MGHHQTEYDTHFQYTRRRREKKEQKNIFKEIMAENFPSVRKKIEIQIQ